MNYEIQQPETKRITLIVQSLLQRYCIDHHYTLANVDVSTILDNFSAGFVARIHARMAGQQVEKHAYPTTWWDAFKARWFPKRLLTKFPANYTTVETWHCYPEYPLPDGGRPIQYLVVSNPPLTPFKYREDK